MASLMPQGKQSYQDDDGTPLAGGKVYAFEAGTATPLATYSDQAGATPNAHPIVLDARGEAAIFWGSAPYKVRLDRADDTEVWTQDDLHASADLADLASTASGKGSALVGYSTGVNTVKAALDERLPEIGTYALLQAYSGSYTSYYVRGVAANLDGGAGVFRVDAADTTSADNGGTILVDASGRRWKREYTGYVHPKWFGAKADGTTDDLAAITAALAVGVIAPGVGIYAVSGEIVIPDGSGIVGTQAHWKRRTGYTYSGTQHTVFKYIGAGGANSCVVRASNKAVGTVGTDFATPGTDDLTDVVLRDFHVDANALAEYGCYVYRAGNQAAIDSITAEKAVKANHVHLGCYAADFGVFGAYAGADQGVICGWDIFSWGTVEATNFSYRARFLTANNGTSNTYVAGTATDQDNAGGKFSVGRGSTVRITSESNFGRACILSQYNIASGSGGPTDYILEYIEGNATGPYVDYRTGMDGLRLKNGFLHPGNGGALVSQDITIEGKDSSGVVTPNQGSADRNEWLVLEGLFGDLSATGFAVDSNTTKFIVRDCTRLITFSSSHPDTDDYIPSENQVGAAVYFTAAASPTVWKATNGVLARTGTGTYTFTFTRPFKTSGQHVPVVSIVLKSVQDQKVELTSISETAVAIRTRDAAGTVADTGDRIGFMMAGPLVY